MHLKKKLSMYVELFMYVLLIILFIYNSFWDTFRLGFR